MAKIKFRGAKSIALVVIAALMAFAIGELKSNGFIEASAQYKGFVMVVAAIIAAFVIDHFERRG